MDYHQLSKVMPLVAAIKERNVPGVQAALDNGADINFRITFDEDKTPLHHAVVVGDAKIVDLLLKNGADPSAKNRDGKTPKELIPDNAGKSKLEGVFLKHGLKITSKPRNSSNSASSLPVLTYNKRKGTTSIRGQLYETKLLALVLFRALHRDDITAFQLATNVDHAEAFDDIVIRYTVNGTDKCIYLQAKHKDCIETNFKDMIDGNTEKGDFSLLKYYKSYLALKIATQSDTLAVDDEFIIFTNIGIKCNIPKDLDLEVHHKAVDPHHLFYTSEGKMINLKGSVKMLLNVTFKWYNESLAAILAKEFICSKKTSSLTEFITLFLESTDRNKSSLEFLQSCYDMLKQEISRSDRDKFVKIKLEIFGLLQNKIFPRAVLSDEDCCSLVTDFLNRLKFFINQADEITVEKILKSEIASFYPHSGDFNLLFHLYHNAVQQWWLQTGDVPFQTKASILFDNARSDLQRNSWLKNLHEISMNKLEMFNVEFNLDKIDEEFKRHIDCFQKNECSLLCVVSNNQTLSCMKLLQYLTSKSFEFSFIDSGIIQIEDFCRKLASEINCLVLTSQDIDTIIQPLQQNVRKIFVVTQTIPKGKTIYVTDMNKGLVDLTNKSQEEILDKIVYFQGSSVLLRTLLDENLDLVDEQTLYNLMMEDAIEVVPDSKSTFQDDEINCYVERPLTRCLIRIGILKDDSFMIVIKGVKDEHHDNDKDIVVVGLATFDIFIQLYFPKSNEYFKLDEAQHIFDLLCAKYPKRNIHLLTIVPPKSFSSELHESLQWEKSQNSIEKLCNYAYHGNVEIELNSLTGMDKRLVMLAAEPGMGKSTYVTALAVKTKQNNPLVWNIRVNLLDFSGTFYEWQKNGVNIDENMAFAFLESVVFNEFSGQKNLKNSFKKHLFYSYCQQKKPILLMDGFDEIWPNYTETVLSLLNIFKDNFISTLWITTRCGSIQKQLELHFGTFSYILQPFKEADCIDFLSKFQRSQLQEDRSVEIEMFKLSTDFYRSLNIDVFQDIDLIRVPLHMKMIATIYESDLQLNTNDSNQNFEFCTERLDLLVLYEKMIKMAFDRLHTDKNKMDITKPSVRQIWEKSFPPFIRKYTILAMHSFFNESDIKLVLSDRDRSSVNDFLQEVEDFPDKTGILRDVIGNVPIFVHRTYAEYFCALYIFEEYASLKEEAFEKFLVTFFVEILVRYDSSRIIQFLKQLFGRREKEILSKDSKAKMLLLHLLENDEMVSNKTTFDLFTHFVEHSIDEHDNNHHLTTAILHASDTKRELLFLAVCKVGCVKLSRILIECIDLSEYGVVFLQLAASNGHASIVTLLVEHGITDDVLTQSFAENIPNSGGTALHFAAKGGYTEVVEILLAKGGAKINIPSVKGYTPLMDAVVAGHFRVVKLLLDNDAVTNICTYDTGTSPLLLATRKGHFDTVKLLIECGAHVNATVSNNGHTPLMEASHQGFRDIVELLLDNKAQVNSATTDHGLTALHMAARNGNAQVVSLLLARGADVNLARKNDGVTPLIEAATFGFKDVVEMLLEKGANCNASSNEGCTALHAASRYGHVEIAKLLLKIKDTNVNFASLDQGYTPLHEASAHGQTTLVNMLLENGAEVDYSSITGATPLHLASAYGHLDVATLLLGKGASVNHSLKDNPFTPLYFAAKNRHDDVVKLLVQYEPHVRFDELFLNLFGSVTFQTFDDE